MKTLPKVLIVDHIGFPGATPTWIADVILDKMALLVQVRQLSYVLAEQVESVLKKFGTQNKVRGVLFNTKKLGDSVGDETHSEEHPDDFTTVAISDAPQDAEDELILHNLDKPQDDNVSLDHFLPATRMTEKTLKRLDEGHVECCTLLILAIKNNQEIY